MLSSVLTGKVGVGCIQQKGEVTAEFSCWGRRFRPLLVLGAQGGERVIWVQIHIHSSVAFRWQVSLDAFLRFMTTPAYLRSRWYLYGSSSDAQNATRIKGA